MSLYTHALFATDFTDDSMKIIPKIHNLLDLSKAKLSLIHVVEHLTPMAYYGYFDIEQQWVQQAKVDLQKVAEQLGVAEADQYIEIGRAKREIIELSKRLNVDLIIVGSHGHSGWTTLLGSTASSILHSAHCDVLMIRSTNIAPEVKQAK